MKISEFLATTDVVSELTGSNSADVLAELCRPIAASNGLDSQALVESLLERERMASSGIGDGVAIVGIWLPFSPFAPALGFVKLPPLYWALLFGTLSLYVLLTQSVKMWLLKRAWI